MDAHFMVMWSIRGTLLKDTINEEAHFLGFRIHVVIHSLVMGFVVAHQGEMIRSIYQILALVDEEVLVITCWNGGVEIGIGQPRRAAAFIFFAVVFVVYVVEVINSTFHSRRNRLKVLENDVPFLFGNLVTLRLQVAAVE
jgi:hypothetical protein